MSLRLFLTLYVSFIFLVCLQGIIFLSWNICEFEDRRTRGTMEFGGWSGSQAVPNESCLAKLEPLASQCAVGSSRY